MAKMKIEIALENKAIEQFNKDYLVNEVKELKENDEKIEEMVMQFLHRGGVSAEEITFMDCYIVKIMAKKYCEAYNDCIHSLKSVKADEDGV